VALVEKEKTEKIAFVTKIKLQLHILIASCPSPRSLT
jgi:hypothetical protein